MSYTPKWMKNFPDEGKKLADKWFQLEKYLYIACVLITSNLFLNSRNNCIRSNANFIWLTYDVWRFFLEYDMNNFYVRHPEVYFKLCNKYFPSHQKWRRNMDEYYCELEWVGITTIVLILKYLQIYAHLLLK